MKNKYISKAETQHLRDEEQQWAEIVASGNECAGLILIYVQKLCTSAHEIEAAFEEELVNETLALHYCQRLKARTERVIELLEQSQASLSSQQDFVDFCTHFKGASEREDLLSWLQQIPEEIHQANHRLCDELARLVLKES